EVTAMTTLLLSYIWVWKGQFAGGFFVCIGLYLGLGIAGHWYRRETAHDVGLRLDNLGIAAWDAARATVPILVVVILIGLAAHSMDYPSLRSWPLRLAGGWIWGFLQQYGLTAFFYRRLLDVVRSVPAASLASASLFALFHLPNVFLMI